MAERKNNCMNNLSLSKVYFTFGKNYFTMNTNFLFPNQFKWLGWLLFIPALAIAFYLTLTGQSIDEMLTAKVFAVATDEFLGNRQFFTVIENSISDELLLAAIVIGGLLVGFSRLKNEDELIAKIRYESLVWAVYVNFGVMLFATIFIYGMYFYHVMLANMFTVLLFFIIRFHVMLYKLNQSANEE